MRLHQIAWVLWIGGTALIVGSWANVVTPTVGWIGFAISAFGAVIGRAPDQVDPSHYPLTQEGFPVEPSDTPIPPDMLLEPGTPLLAHSQGRWWRATVISVEGNGEVLVRFPGWDDKWVARLPRKALHIDPDPNRRPMTLPSGTLERWNGGEKASSEGVRTPDQNKRIQE